MPEKLLRFEYPSLSCLNQKNWESKVTAFPQSQAENCDPRSLRVLGGHWGPPDRETFPEHPRIWSHSALHKLGQNREDKNRHAAWPGNNQKDLHTWECLKIGTRKAALFLALSFQPTPETVPSSGKHASDVFMQVSKPAMSPGCENWRVTLELLAGMPSPCIYFLGGGS